MLLETKVTFDLRLGGIPLETKVASKSGLQPGPEVTFVSRRIQQAEIAASPELSETKVTSGVAGLVG